MSWRIREMTTADYPGMMAVQNEIYPDRPKTVEEWKEGDRTRDPRCKFRRWVVETDRQIVGYGLYTYIMHKFDSHRFLIAGVLLEFYRKQGIGVAWICERRRVSRGTIRPR